MLQQQEEQRRESDRILLAVCYANRGKLEDYWRTGDVIHTGKLTLAQLFTGLKKCDPDFVKFDLLRLLEVTELASQSAVDAGFVTGGRILTSSALRMAAFGGSGGGGGGNGYGGDGGVFSGAMASAEKVQVDYLELLRRLQRAIKLDRSAQVKQRIAAAMGESGAAGVGSGASGGGGGGGGGGAGGGLTKGFTLAGLMEPSIKNTDLANDMDSFRPSARGRYFLVVRCSI
jgi:hypothetical protein